MSKTQAEFELLERRYVPATIVPQELSYDSRAEVSTEAEQWSPNAWNLDTNLARLTYGLYGYGQTVAIIDSGIAYDHTALGGGLGSNHRVVGGWDFAENDANPYDDGPLGFHGTHVAGIVASDNSTYKGVAPGVDLVALRVFDDHGNGDAAWITSALWWVHQHQHSFEFPITTVNLSLGFAQIDNPSRVAIDAALDVLEDDGIFISVSAGNDFSGNTDVKFPASSTHAIPVASVGPNGSLSNFSMRNQRVLAAPGESIVSTVPDYLFSFNGVTDDFMAASGTSMAAPHVAGASVLLRETYDKLGQRDVSQQQLYNQFVMTSDSIFDSNTSANYHRLNLQRAIENVTGPDEAQLRWLGSVATAASYSGTVNNLQDVDRFSFTAASSGSITMDSAWTGSSSQAPLTTILGATETAPGRFQVVAGQTYTLSLTARGSIGRYEGQLILQPQNSTIAAAPSARSNEGLQTWTAAAAGWYDIRIHVASPERVDEIRIQGANGELRYLANQISSEHQIQLQVAAGEQLTFALSGYSPAADISISAMSFTGGTDGGGGTGSPSNILAGIYLELPLPTTHFALCKPGELALETVDPDASTDEALARHIDPIWLRAIATGNASSAKTKVDDPSSGRVSELEDWLEHLFADSLSLTVGFHGEDLG